MFISLIYDCFLAIFALFTLPKFLYHKKNRNTLKQKLGMNYPKIEKGNSTLIWIHAVSVGETRAVSPSVKKLRAKHPQATIVISSITETGHTEAKKSIPEANAHVFLPFDFRWTVSPIIKQAKPDLVILCETDFWYHFLKSCKEVGAKVCLVNGKLSERSLKMYRKFSWLSKHLFSQIDHFYVQGDLYRERFLKLGISVNAITVTGNMKCDEIDTVLTQEERLNWKRKLGIPQENLVIVAGSTHHPEETLILNAYRAVKKVEKNVTLILVPRHPERFDQVATLLKNENIPFTRYSSKPAAADVILIDAMGILRNCYQIADIAIVAGSFTPKVGGHNITEPSWYGVPVIYGPYMHAQPDLVDLVKHYQAGLQCNAADLPEALIKLIQDPSQRTKMGSAGQKMMAQSQGAVRKTLNLIDKTLVRN